MADSKWIEHYGLADIPMEHLWLIHYEKGEYLCRDGETLSHILLMTSGKVRVSVTGFNGKSLLYCINVNTGILGSIELLIDHPATASGQAITPVTCIGISIDENLDLLKGSLPFMYALAKELSLAFLHSSRLSTLNILYPLETRLCSYIAMTQEHGQFQEKLTDVNALLGTSYRHLLRTLDALCEQGVLSKMKKGYTIVNQAKLDSIADGYYSV